MHYMEITVNFAIPNDDRSIIFVNLLENLINDHVFPRIITEEFYYYGILADEWLDDLPTPESAVAFSFGLPKAPHRGNPNHPSVTAEEMEEVEDAPRHVEFLREKLRQSITLRAWSEKFSREKSSPRVDFEEAVQLILDELTRLENSDVRSPEDTLAEGQESRNLLEYDWRKSSHVRSPEYDKGYADGFEAGGGDVSEDLIREREKEVAEMREATFLARVGGLGSSHVRSSDDGDKEAVDPR